MMVSTPRLRRMVAASLFLVVPVPMVFLSDASVPAARFALLAAISAWVMIREGSGGPVSGVVLLFGLHALVYGLACLLIPRLVTFWLTESRARHLLGAVLAAVCLLWIMSLFFEIYHTPFGPRPWSTWIGVLS